MTLAAGTQSWRRSRMRDVLVLIAGLGTVAAGATERQSGSARPVFSFVNTAREAGLTAITVYGGSFTSSSVYVRPSNYRYSYNNTTVARRGSDDYWNRYDDNVPNAARVKARSSRRRRGRPTG